jgi:hypothetical protein
MRNDRGNLKKWNWTKMLDNPQHCERNCFNHCLKQMKWVDPRAFQSKYSMRN